MILAKTNMVSMPEKCKNCNCYIKGGFYGDDYGGFENYGRCGVTGYIQAWDDEPPSWCPLEEREEVKE